MTVVVNLRNSEEEKVLLAFLDSLDYDYESDTADVILSEEQAKQILRRDKAFAERKISARPWNEIKKELDSIYR